MNQSDQFATMLRRAMNATAGASVVRKPVIRKKQKPVKDAIYGVAEPKKKVVPKKLNDRELQRIWDRNQAKMVSKTKEALASMQRSASPQRLPPVPAVPIGRPTMPGILSTSPMEPPSPPLWRVK